MAVIVNQGFVAELLTADNEARSTVWTKASNGPDHPPCIHIYGDERRAIRDKRSPRAGGCAAGKERSRASGKSPAVNQHAASLAALGLSLQSFRQ